MSSPTRAEIDIQLQDVTEILEEVRKFAKDNTPNFITLQDTLTQNAESDFAPAMLTAIQSARGGLASILGNGRGALDPVISAYGKFIDAPEADQLIILGRVYDDFIDNSLTVQSRGFTFGPVVAGGSNVGNGTIKRLNVDENNLDIENQTPDAKLAELIRDANSGAIRNREIFQLRGGFGGIDVLDIEGVGDSRELESVDSTQSLVRNSGFDTLDGNTVTTLNSIPNWVVTDTSDVSIVVSSNLELDATAANLFLPRVNDNETRHALVVTGADVRLRQKLVNIGQNLNVNSPYYLRIGFRRDLPAWAGTLTIKMGSVTASVVIAAEVGFTVLEIHGISNNWFRNFNENDLAIVIDAVRTSGTKLYLDDLTFVRYVPFDGGWYIASPGQTPFKEQDIFNFTDTATESIIQRIIWILYGVYLPHSGTPTLADP